PLLDRGLGKGYSSEATATRALARATEDGVPDEEAHARLLLAELGASDALQHRKRARELLLACGATREAGLVPSEAA
ncbi:MAG: hypothetical protein ACK4YP_22215, partial [Myxococcota bacterium]